MKFLVTAAILLSCLGATVAIECHVCSYLTGITDNSCNDPFNAAGNATDTCEGTYCVKSKSSADGNILSMSRACSETCSEACVSLLSIEGCTYCCQSKLCNGADIVASSMVSTVLMVTATFKLFI